MKKPFQIILTFLYFIVAFILLQPVWVWIKGGGYDLTKENIVFGTYLGIVVPALMFLSKKIRSTWLYIPLAICIMVLLVFVKNLIFPA